MNELEKRGVILNLIQENAGVDGMKVREDMKLFEDLEYDSLRVITLITEIEKTFQFEFEEYDQLMDAVDSVGSFIDYFMTIIE